MSAIMRAALDAITYLTPESYDDDADVDTVLTDVRRIAREALGRVDQEESGEARLWDRLKKLLEETA